MAVLPIAIAAVAIFITCGFVLHAIWRRRSPPGPMGLPLIGSLPDLFSQSADPKFRWYLYMQRLRSRYGNVASVQLGSQEFVVISSYEKIKSAFVDSADSFSHRPNGPFYQLMAKQRGIILSEGPLWREHRRFALRVLRDFGLGRSLSEQQIQLEAGELVKSLSALSGKSVDVEEHISKAVVNVIANLVFGQRTGYDDPQFDEYMQHSAVVVQTSLVTLLFILFPWIPPQLYGLLSGPRKYSKSQRWVMDFCQAKIDNIKSRHVAGSEANCYVEAYINEQAKQEASGQPIYEDYQLLRSVFDLFLAGSDTTANTLRWALLYCSINQRWQQACHQEILDTIGARQVCMKDKKQMHVVQAVLDEVQRLSVLVPMSVEHRCPEDTQFDGSTISKNAVISVNLYSVLHDPDLFPDPEKFDPSRFINQEDGTYQPSEFLIPFSIGRRSCLGEMLARMELFIIFVTLMQHLRFELSEETAANVEEILIGLDGVVHAPAHHTLLIHSRD